MKTFGNVTENLYLYGWKGVQVKLGRGLMATPPIFYFPVPFFFSGGVLCARRRNSWPHAHAHERSLSDFSQ